MQVKRAMLKALSGIVKYLSYIWVSIWPISSAGFVLQRKQPTIYTKRLACSIISIIKPGDLVLTGTYGYLHNAFIPGKVSHVGIYIGAHEDHNHAVAHIDQTGFRIDSIDLFTYVDFVEIWRPREALSRVELDKLLMIIDTYRNNNINYDFLFNTKNTKFYCSELIVMLMHYIRPAMMFATERSLGRAVYLPGSFQVGHYKKLSEFGDIPALY